MVFGEEASLLRYLQTTKFIDFSSVLHLIQSGANPCFTDERGITPLKVICKKIEEAPINEDAMYWVGKTPYERVRSITQR